MCDVVADLFLPFRSFVYASITSPGLCVYVRCQSQCGISRGGAGEHEDKKRERERETDTDTDFIDIRP